MAAVRGLRLNSGDELEARVGIATGQVVVGDLIGEAAVDAEAVIGETPNLAARLLGVAEPGQVVIGAMTRELVGRSFQFEDLGARPLKGFAEPVQAWRAIGESAVESRFEAAHAGSIAGLVGRVHELSLLRERWGLVKAGEGQVVLLSGEAGIGKSRIVRAISEEIADEDSFQMHCQCSPYHSNSALFPIIRQLERAAGIAAADSGDGKLDKLEALLRGSAGDFDTMAPELAALLSVPADRRYGAHDLTPQQRRERTFAALIDYVLAQGRQRPVLLLVEDIHWIDPTTEALLSEIMARVADRAVFVLVTYRQDFAPPWANQAHATAVVLKRLSRGQGAEIVRAVGGDALPETTVERIIARADGVPLFVEELTKSVLEAGARCREDSIPATLQASLMARLDRLGAAREVVQVGAVVGREFAHDLLAAVVDKTAAELAADLDQLIRSGLVFRAAGSANAVYTFKHALVQDAAYESLLKAKRQRLHRQIAEALQSAPPAQTEAQPDLLAHHFTEAGDPNQAAIFWAKAGEIAAQRSAHLEAAAHLTKGLELLQELPETLDRARLELAMQTTLGPVHMATKGYGSEVVEAAYLRARSASALTIRIVCFRCWSGSGISIRCGATQ